MNQKIIFVLTLAAIAFIIFISELQSGKTGTIKSITYTSSITIIELENSTEKLVIFSNKNLSIFAGEQISYVGKEQIYNNETEIVVDKIELLR